MTGSPFLFGGGGGGETTAERALDWRYQRGGLGSFGKLCW